ncbi:MAG: hypothetical protein HQP61_04900 [Peptococcaceae bacterium]|nr:hypothetical protein [Candidatus Syntrophopropionicum ammoniitolerans]
MIIIINHNEDYLKQKQIWVELRMAALGEMEAKLLEMRSLAAYARDNYINRDVAQKLTTRLGVLQEEINMLDEQTRVFWMDCQ